MWRRRDPPAQLEDIVELLQGIGTILMTIAARLEAIIELLGGDEDEEADP